MFETKNVVLLLAVFCSVQPHYGNGAIQGSRASKGLIFMGKKSFDEGNLIFVVCDKNTPSTTACTVVQRVYPNKGNAHLCNVTLNGDGHQSIQSITIGVSTLGKDKAILFWEDVDNKKTSTKIGTINLETCEMNEVKIPDPNRDIVMDLHLTDKIVSYDDDSYDIYINDPTRFGEKLGKMEINGDGTVKGEPIASKIKRLGLIDYLAPIATRSSSKGYAYVRQEATEFILFLVKSDGSEMKLAKYTNNVGPIVTASDNVVSACTEVHTNSDVICTRYDENGNVKFTTTIDAAEDTKTRPKALYNLPDGGMLVLVAEPKKCDKPSICNNESEHRMVRIASDGKILGTAAIKDFDTAESQSKQTYVYKHGDSEYCAALIGDNPVIDKEEQSDYEIIHHCVEEDEFLA